MYKTKGTKSTGVLILTMLAGVVAGGFLGNLITTLSESVGFLSFLKALNYSNTFGLTSPLALDLGILSFSFGFTIKFSVWGIIGLISSYLIYRRM